VACGPRRRRPRCPQGQTHSRSAPGADRSGEVGFWPTAAADPSQVPAEQPLIGPDCHPTYLDWSRGSKLASVVWPRVAAETLKA
jgi:hypothetical protein